MQPRFRTLVRLWGEQRWPCPIGQTISWQTLPLATTIPDMSSLYFVKFSRPNADQCRIRTNGTNWWHITPYTMFASSVHLTQPIVRSKRVFFQTATVLHVHLGKTAASTRQKLLLHQLRLIPNKLEANRPMSTEPCTKRWWHDTQQLPVA